VTRIFLLGRARPGDPFGEPHAARDGFQVRRGAVLGQLHKILNHLLCHCLELIVGRHSADCAHLGVRQSSRTHLIAQEPKSSQCAGHPHVFERGATSQRARMG
jgi:hypothetical protein